jgi:O-antigen ligase
MLYRTRKEPGLLKVRVPTELWVLLAWMLLSVTWSPHEFTSFKRYGLVIGALMIGVLTTRMTPLDQSSTKFLLVPLISYMVLGLVHLAISPDKAFDQDGAMRSYSIHKNAWGQFCLLYTLVLAHAVLTKKNNFYYMVLMVPAVAMLYMSKSATSILAFASTALVIGTLTSLLSHRLLGVTLLCLFLAGASVSTLVFTVVTGELPFDHLVNAVFKATDKSTTLTGRTHLWYLMWGEISRHLWTGTGIGGFWTGLEGASGVLARQLDWGPPGQAHSGYIDMLNEIGIIGMALLLLLLLRHLKNCWKLYRHGHRDGFIFHSSIATAFLTVNYAESTLFLGSNLWFIIFISSIVHASSLCSTPEMLGKDRPVKHKKPTSSAARLARPAFITK